MLVFVGGIIFRVAYLTKYPMGTNPDEAYAGYEAYALIHAGMDSHGYHFPVYFISWGSGMNVLYSWISMPFIGLGGLSLLTVRLPQALMGCMTLIIFYLLLREIKDAEFALVGMFLLSINPWHIMMCRWGLESNIAPAMILIAVFFLTKAYCGKGQFYVPAFFFFGLSLYAYAVMWAFVPIFLLLALVYGFRMKRICIDKYLITGVLILGAMALPLLLFVAVNKGYLPEMRTVLFSIPRMNSMRAEEISFHNISGKLTDLILFLVKQIDRDSFNTSNVGIYYFCSVPFVLIGLSEAIWSFTKSWKKRAFEPSNIMLIWFLAAFLVGCVISYVNVNKINCIHLPMIYFTASGCVFCIRKIHKNIIYPIVIVYVGFFCVFCSWYYNEGKIDFYYGYKDALEYANEITDGDIGVVMIRYSNLLMESKMLPEEYLPQTDGYKNYDEVDCFGRYRMNPDASEMQPDVVYVVPKAVKELYLRDRYTEQYDNGYYSVIFYE